MRDFLLSIENCMRVTSLTTNEDHAKNFVCCDTGIERHEKSWTRKLHRKALNEEFCFIGTPGSHGGSLSVLAKIEKF